MKMRMSYVRLLVDNFDECFDFYTVHIGAKVTWGAKGEAYAEFQLGDDTTRIAIFRREVAATALRLEGAAAPASDRFSLILEVDDVDAWARNMEVKGVPLVARPVDREKWGVRTVHFRDPAGNLIEINCPLEQTAPG
jgi:catechol 2,3-dioxygenase-like lactoylglutathione lyase family enzyme